MFDGIREFVIGFSFVELGVTAVLLLGGFGAPIPEDIPLLLAGFFCSEAGGRLSRLSVMLPLTYAAVLGADLIVFELGRRFGARVVYLPWLRRVLTESRLEKVSQTFHKHGGKTLAIARFLPGLRSAIFITAGVFRVPRWKMLVYDGTAALVSVPLWVLVGYACGEHIPQILNFAQELKAWLFLAGFVALGFVLFRQAFLRPAPRPDVEAQL